MSLRLIATSYQGQRLAPGQKSIMFIDKGEITIGRAQDNDWVLPDPDRRLSRRHCIIWYQDGSYYLTDTSTNGVFVNHAEQRVGWGQMVRLNDGDVITMGDYEIQVSFNLTPALAPGSQKDEIEAKIPEDCTENEDWWGPLPDESSNENWLGPLPDESSNENWLGPLTPPSSSVKRPDAVPAGESPIRVGQYPIDVFRPRTKLRRKEIKTQSAVVTLATPKYFAKGNWTRILIYCHTDFLEDKIRSYIEQQKDIENIRSQKVNSKIWDQYIKVKILPERVIEVDVREKILLTYPEKKFTISLRPNDNAQINQPIPASLLLLDFKTNEELVEVPFDMNVKDFSFDHISRPLIQKLLSGGVILCGSCIIVLESIMELGAKSVFGLPLGELLVGLGATSQIFSFWKYGKKSKNFDSLD